MDATLDKFMGFLEAESGLGREVIVSSVEEKVKVCGGIVSEYGALYSVGREFGVDIGDVYSHKSIKELSGGEPVCISARVKNNSGLRSFKKKDGGSGQFTALTLADASGEIRVMVWGEHAMLVWKAAAGDIVSFKDCVLRVYQGRQELHTLAESKVQVYPKPASS